MTKKESDAIMDSLAKKSSTYIVFYLVEEKKVNDDLSQGVAAAAVRGKGHMLVQLLQKVWENDPRVADLFMEALTFYKMAEFKERMELEKAKQRGDVN